MDISNVTIGSDVEFFVAEKASGVIVSAEGMIPGTKHEPFRFDEANHWFATQLDNVLAEGNIPPATSPAEFSGYLERLRKHLDSALPPSFATIALSSARLSVEALATPAAQTFGCEPSINAWTGEMLSVDPGNAGTLRTAGFHIHVGYDERNVMTNAAIARAMDVRLGIPSVLADTGADAQARREFGYGKAGSFRHQPWGLEYRVLSGAMAADARLQEWAFRATLDAIEDVRRDRKWAMLLDHNVYWTQQIINNGDMAAAEKVSWAFHLELP